MDKNLPVGVIDSGVGGLSVLKVFAAGTAARGFFIYRRYGAHTLRAAPGKGNSHYGA